MKRKVIKVTAALLVLLVLSFFTWRVSIFRLTKNFHEVDPGKFYRSAQLTGDEFSEVIKKYGIKTVINLRGMGHPWAEEQKHSIAKSGAKLFNVSFRTEYVPEKKSLSEYMNLLETAERPILIHCRSGADRTGEETAIYAVEYMGMTPEEASDKYLNFKYWHVPLFQPSKKAFMKQYKGKEWAKTEYDPCDKSLRKYKRQGEKCPVN